MEMVLTKHAINRKQQRGFCDTDIDVIFEFGDGQYHKGCEIICVTKASLKKLKKY